MKLAAVPVAAGVLLAIYVAAFVALPPGVFYSPDEGAKYLQLRTIGWDGGLTYRVAYGGGDLDPTYRFYPTHCRHLDIYPLPLPDGGVRLQWPIWFALVTAWPTALLGLRGLYVVPLLSGWIAALLSGWLAAIYDRRLAAWAILAVGLATPVAFFSQTYWEHTLATALALAAVALLAARDARPGVAWLGLPLLLAAIALRIELVALAAAVGLALWMTPAASGATTRPPRWWLRLAAGALGLAAGLAWLAPFIPFRHVWALSELPDYLRGAVAKLPHLRAALVALLIDAPGNSAPALPEWTRAVAALAFGAAAAAPFLPGRARNAVGVAACSVALVFSATLASHPAPYMSVHGLLPVAPFLILAAWALPDALRSRRVDRRFVACLTVLYLVCGTALQFIFTIDAEGRYRTGLEWGNRYLMLLYPLGTVLALAGITAWRRATDGALRQLVTGLAVALLLCGVQSGLRGLWVLYGSRTLVAEWQAAVARHGPLVSDIWWLPAAMAPHFANEPMFCVRDRAELAEWIELAAAHGVETFTVATFRDLAPPAAAAADAGRVPVAGLRVTRYRLGGG
ncbi:MAG: hypothetical protein SF182_26975 [Deltaproteobacteria bacterium]|nr:hypothetical protein [Deltaproteobacteria bacterium]